MRPIRQALAIGAVATLAASCGTSPQLRTLEAGSAAREAARYHVLQTLDACACNAAFATAEGPGIDPTRIYRTAFGVVDQNAPDLAQVQVAIYDLSTTPTGLTLYGNDAADVTISGTSVTLTSMLIRSAGQDPRAIVGVTITLDAATGLVNLSIDNVPVFTGFATTYGLIPGSCARPPFLAIPEPPDDAG